MDDMNDSRFRELRAFRWYEQLRDVDDMEDLGL